MIDIDNSKDRRYYVKIIFNKDSKYPTLSETVYYRDNMSLDFFMRWKWYFQYREALLRVQNPRSFVELSHGSYDYILPSDEYKKKIYNLLLAAKRKQTELNKKIDYV